MFIGLSKAFDTLNHNILLDKLKSYNRFKSYLDNRHQYAQIDESNSQHLKIYVAPPRLHSGSAIVSNVYIYIYIHIMSIAILYGLLTEQYT